MLFKDIVATKYKIFSRMGEEKRIEQIDAVKYIFLIASTSGVVVSNWDCQEVFKSDRGGANEIVTSKTTINQRFFEKVEALSVLSPTPPPADLVEAEKVALRNLSQRYIADMIARAENDAINRLRSAFDYQKSAQREIEIAARSRMSIAGLSGNTPNIAEQVQTINEGSFWEYDGMEPGANLAIAMKTRNDVVCTHKNPSAGIDISVNLGKFRATFDMGSVNLLVFGCGDNVAVGGYNHPHISYNGRVCWGNGQEAANKATANMQLVQLFTLLSSVLVNYNSGNPYRSLEDFRGASMSSEERESRERLEQAARDRSDAERAAREREDTECPDCGWPLDDCHCHWCLDCDRHADDCICGQGECDE